MADKAMLVVVGDRGAARIGCVLFGNRGGLAILEGLAAAGFRRVEELAILAGGRPLTMIAGGGATKAEPEVAAVL